LEENTNSIYAGTSHIIRADLYPLPTRFIAVKAVIVAPLPPFWKNVGDEPG